MLQSLRILVGALLSAVFVITVAMGFVLGVLDDAFEPSPLLALPVVLAVGAVLLSETVGYRHPAIAPGTPKADAGRRSAAAYSAGTILRFAVCEAVLLVSLALAFVVDRGGYLTVLVGAAITFGLVWFECWPRERPFARSIASLERDGGTSYLRETCGLPTDTVVREL